MLNLVLIFFVVIVLPLTILILSVSIASSVQMIKFIVETWKPLPNAWRRLVKERPGRAMFLLGYFLVLTYLSFLFYSWVISHFPK
jgi:hypothetical protein